MLERLAARLRTEYAADLAVLADSGTSALALAIAAALRRRPGAPVALPAYCCYDVATAAAAADAPVLLYDVDPATLGPDWLSLQRALSAGAGAVVVAHLFGLAVDVVRAAAACAATGAVMIEDAAQGAGGQLGGAPLGAHASLSVLSFGRGKGITGGRGGALLARHDSAELLNAPGVTLAPGTGGGLALAALSAQWVFARPTLYALPAALPFLRLGETVYRAPHPLRLLTAGPAAVVLDSLAQAGAEGLVRRARARKFNTAAAEARVTVPAPLTGSEPGYLRFPLLVEGGRLVGDASPVGVAHGYPRALADLPEVTSRCRNCRDAFPGARTLASRLVTVPTHSRLSERDVLRIVDWVRTCGGSR